MKWHQNSMHGKPVCSLSNEARIAFPDFNSSLSSSDASFMSSSSDLSLLQSSKQDGQSFRGYIS